MSLDPPTYLSSMQNNIRARPIPWDGAVRAGTITEDQLSKIRAVDKVRKEQRKQTVEADINGYRALFIGGEGQPSVVESFAKRADVVQYLLVLLGDLIDAVPTLPAALGDHPEPFQPFLPLLRQTAKPEEPVPLLASIVLASLIAGAPEKSSSAVEAALPKLYSYFSTLAKSSDGGLQDIAVLQYSTLLRSKKARLAFWDQRQETVTPLIDILKAAGGVSASSDLAATLVSGSSNPRAVEGVIGGGVGLQLLYHVLLVLWQLSFEGETVGEGLDEEYDIIPLYTQLLRLSPKEKTTRLLLSTTYNLLSTNQATLLPVANLVRFPALLQNITGRHLSDPDLLEDLKNLTEMLEEYAKTQTTFDQYASEVNSGHLRWSPPHRNPTFWAENARKILDYEKGEIPKKLAAILSKPWDNDKQVLAIGCNDIGWLVKEVPEKRYQLEKLGLKTRVMELMTEPDETIRWESLRAVGEWLRYSFETK